MRNLTHTEALQIVVEAARSYAKFAADTTTEHSIAAR
jgi:hypothetical protein